MPGTAQYVERLSEGMSIKWNNRVYEKQRSGHDVIALSSGEASFDIPLFSFADLPVPEVYRYSHSRGVPELRDLLAEHYCSSSTAFARSRASAYGESCDGFIRLSVGPEDLERIRIGVERVARLVAATSAMPATAGRAAAGLVRG